MARKSDEDVNENEAQVLVSQRKYILTNPATCSVCILDKILPDWTMYADWMEHRQRTRSHEASYIYLVIAMRRR